jgi:hypothetical protein
MENFKSRKDAGLVCIVLDQEPGAVKIMLEEVRFDPLTGKPSDPARTCLDRAMLAEEKEGLEKRAADIGDALEDIDALLAQHGANS